MIKWGTVSEWVVALATFVLAGVAVFQETIRGCFYHPKFHVSIKTDSSGLYRSTIHYKRWNFRGELHIFEALGREHRECYG